jgi:glucokinase
MTAGEIGHMILQDAHGPICGCGNTGCLEALASGPSIVKMANDYIQGGKSAKFVELANGADITPFIIYEAAMQGDAVSRRIFTIVGEWLGVALTSVVNLLNPEKIIIGGGVSLAGDLLIEPIRKTINERAIKVSAEAVQVVSAQLGERAGVIGASLLIEK